MQRLRGRHRRGGTGMSNFQFNRDANGNPFWHAPLPNKAWDAGNKSVSMWDRCQLCGEAWPCAFIKELTRAVPVTGIWLRAKSGGVLEVLAEIDGEWRVVIRQAYLDG